MGLHDVENDILRKGEQEVKAILLDGHKEADTLLANAKKSVAEARKKADQSTDDVLAMLERRETAAAAFDMRKAILNAKKSIITKVVEKVRQELDTMPAKKREDIIVALIVLAQREINVRTAYANPKDKKAVTTVKAVAYQPGEMAGGIIAETADGKIRVDYRYEEILREIQETCLQELGRILF